MNNTIKLLKNKPFIIPESLIKNYKVLKLSELELIIIIYFINNSNVFNPKAISKDLNWKLADILETVNSLTDKNIIKIELKKRGGVREETINLDGLYHKLAFLYTDVKEERETSIFDQFEKEFGRTLSPIEFELVNSWLEDNSEELILLALKEAVYNGVSNFRYIDKIIHEWKRKGIKNASDLKKKGKKQAKKTETFDYDWLNETDS